MKVLVTGGRKYLDKVKVFSSLDKLHKENPITLLIHGAAKGADSLANCWAEDRKVPIKRYHARWNQYGPSAGAIRNSEMLKEMPHIVLAFPGGTGTADCVRQAEHLNLLVLEVEDEPIIKLQREQT